MGDEQSSYYKVYGCDAASNALWMYEGWSKTGAHSLQMDL